MRAREQDLTSTEFKSVWSSVPRSYPFVVISRCTAFLLRPECTWTKDILLAQGNVVGINEHPTLHHFREHLISMNAELTYKGAFPRDGQRRRRQGNENVLFVCIQQWSLARTGHDDRNRGSCPIMLTTPDSLTFVPPKPWRGDAAAAAPATLGLKLSCAAFRR